MARENNCKGPWGSLLRWGNFLYLDCGSYTNVYIYQNSSNCTLEMDVLFHVNTLIRILLCAWHYCLLLNSEDMLLYIKCKNGFICQRWLIRKSNLKETNDWWAYLESNTTVQERLGKPWAKSSGVVNSEKEREGSHIAQVELIQFVNWLEIKGNQRRHSNIGNWEDHDTIKMSKATFTVRHLLTILF